MDLSSFLALRGNVADNADKFRRFRDAEIMKRVPFDTVSPSKRGFLTSVVNLFVAWDVNFTKMSWESVHNCNTEYSGMLFPVSLDYNMRENEWSYRIEAPGSPLKVQIGANGIVQHVERLGFYTADDIEYANSMITCVLMH